MHDKRYDGSSFFDLLRIDHAHLLHNFRLDPIHPLDWKRMAEHASTAPFPMGTTVLSLRYADGALLAGDRMATEGFSVSARRIEKVFRTDGHSAIAIAGAAGPAIEVANLFRIELEHYEKIEGEELDLEGKANKLGQMIRQNLPAAMQGLIVIPLFAGFDRRADRGRIYKYDVTGGRYEETEYYSIGSGGKDARSSMKKTFQSDVSLDRALDVAMTALGDAAEEDIGTGGVDTARGIYPTVMIATRDGVSEVPEEKVKGAFESILKKKASGN